MSDEGATTCPHCGEDDPDHFGFEHTITLTLDIRTGIQTLEGYDRLCALLDHFETVGEETEENGYTVEKQVSRRICYSCDGNPDDPEPRPCGSCGGVGQHYSGCLD